MAKLSYSASLAGVKWPANGQLMKMQCRNIGYQWLMAGNQ